MNLRAMFVLGAAQLASAGAIGCLIMILEAKKRGKSSRTKNAVPTQTNGH